MVLKVKIYFNIPIKLREETELSIRKYINVQCDNIIELHDIIALARYFDIALKNLIEIVPYPGK